MKIFYSTITSVHGLNGEVECTFIDKSYFASLPILNNNTNIYIDNQEYKIINIKKKNKSFVFKLEKIDSIDDAKALIGKDIYIDYENLPSLDDNSFYEAEIIGYNVIDSNGKLYGKVVDLYSLPSNYVFVISLENSKEEVSIPFVGAYFGKIDKTNRVLEIIEKPIVDEE
ncbi:ribosome maturation factor RimM [Brachyspira pilosicoli]|uniref:ribosome maturation factor RimM n=1 Tax=Brachyspira pilosicoli TaxID=52584 RepID=UPI00242E2631|nr:ribosome maturation factor RimM [Brachyspira pilosicoli]